ncbi:site-specific integrase [Parabacteroides chongii]|uniref:site-specific integrase n=1 Tax=Parabacteroides chongii TaxID=2685834 RepID=UPI00240D9FAE|nr:site-specific integrase [Parabacteroides chongii]WFE85006.1 site-specific integrase [Parabacteroides chongii]
MMEISNTRLAQVRDVFCFCCFTGLRYSDVYNLKKTDIKDTKIDIVTIKDVDNINIELNKYSRAILDKYKDLDIKKGKALPVISNQNYNDYLKELGQLAEMNEEMTEVWYVGSKRMERTVKKWEVLTTHVARKTFVVNALTLGISPQVIMRWTGHNDIKAMKPYTKIVDKLKEQEMKKFDEM